MPIDEVGVGPLLVYRTAAPLTQISAILGLVNTVPVEQLAVTNAVDAVNVVIWQYAGPEYGVGRTTTGVCATTIATIAKSAKKNGAKNIAMGSHLIFIVR